MPKFNDTEIYGDLKVTGKAELSEDSTIEDKKIATEEWTKDLFEVDDTTLTIKI